MTILPFGQIAPTSRRAIAYVIDALIAGGIGIVLGGILVTIAVATGSPEGILLVLAIGMPVVVALELAWLLIYTFMQSGTGSIGMRAQGVRLVDAANGESIGFWRALLRNVVFGLAASIVVGYFTPLFDGSGRFQGWHDKVAKSVVLDARASASAAPLTQAMPMVSTPMPSGHLPQPSGSPVRPPLPTTPVAGAPVAPRADVASPPSVSPLAPSPQPAVPAQPVPPVPGPATATPAPANPTSDPLIAFVPGITQDAPPVRPEQPAPAAQQPVPPAPAAPSAPAAPAAPSAPAAPAAPAAPFAASIPPAPAAPVSAPAPVVTPSAPDEDLDDEDIESTRISIPGHRLVFTWDDGTKVSVSRRTVFGRNPAEEDGAVVVPVRDETLSLSKTHFEAAAEAAGGWVRDLHSTNGLTIVRDGRRLSCPPGERVPIRLGDAIEIGDRIVTIGGYA